MSLKHEPASVPGPLVADPALQIEDGSDAEGQALDLLAIPVRLLHLKCEAVPRRARI